MAANHSPSGVVAVMKGGEMIFAKGYGYMDVEKRIPVDPAGSLASSAYDMAILARAFLNGGTTTLALKGRLALIVAPVT
jgi:CubicO group peptidase (beta-lactamase class C family)